MTSKDASPRGRGPTKPYPSMTFEDAKQLAEGVIQFGIEGSIKRLTLLGQMKVSPNSSKTRTMFTSSRKYGLTEGSYNSADISITDIGKAALSDASAKNRKKLQLQLSIEEIPAFRKVYEKLQGNALRTVEVVQDLLQEAGVAKDDATDAARVFERNLRFVGVVRDISGTDYVVPFEEIEDQINDPKGSSIKKENPSAAEEEKRQKPEDTEQATKVPGFQTPTIHIDIQIHIDSSAKSEQIDQIFSSMAKHLYDRQKG